MTASTARQTFRETLAGLATRTQARLPQLNGRVEKACKLVLAGDVELHADGTALVHSLSDPTRAYQLAQGVCQCKDWGQAPEHLCCHRLAVGFLRKVHTLVPTPPPAPPLPEARTSLNFRAMVHGFEVQITLRDDAEDVLMHRLQTLLTRQDIRPIPTPAPRAGNWKGGRRG